VAEAQITEEQLELVRHGYELLNSDNYDALVDLMAPDVVMERDGGQPPLVGRDEVRKSLDPDAFEWMRNEPLSFEVNGEKVLVQVRVRAKGSTSGLELEMVGWQVLTTHDGVVVHMLATFDEQRALEAFRAPAGPSQG
jgi:ketosteroid isomerase-like protein